GEDKCEGQDSEQEEQGEEGDGGAAGADSIEQGLQEMTGERSQSGAGGDAEGDARGRHAGEIRDDLLALGAESHADADFAAALHYGAGEDAVEAGSDERKGEESESAGDGGE